MSNFNAIQHNANIWRLLAPFVGGKAEKVVMCDVANPLLAGHSACFKLFLAPVASQIKLDALNFLAVVNCTNEEPRERHEQRNNQVSFRIPVFAEAQLVLSGVSFPEQVNYCRNCTIPSVITEEQQIGPEVTHIYQVYNAGPSTMEKGQVRLIWPSPTNRSQVQYLLEEPHIEGNTNCTKVGINLLHVALFLNKALHYGLHSRHQPSAETSAARKNRNVETPFNSLWSSEGNAERAVRLTRDAHDQDNKLAKQEWQDPQKACGASDCTFITCDIGRLMERERVVITLRARLWEDSLRKLQFGDSISSKALVKVHELSYGFLPRTNQYYSIVVKTLVVPSDHLFASTTKAVESVVT